MIQLYDIVNSANEFIPKEKGMLVLHRSMKERPNFKVFKIFEYNLWFVKGKKKTLLLTNTNTKKAPLDKLEELWEEADKEFIAVLIQFILSEDYKKLCDNELLPDRL